MEYPFYSAARQYPLFSVAHPQPTETPPPNQFQLQLDQEHFDPTYQPLDSQFAFDSSALLGTPAPPSSDNYGKYPLNSHIIDDNDNGSNSNGATQVISGREMQEVPADFNHHSSSEEKETLTPAQSRRKAQNRAAQRAFRERKERRVRDLEQELNEYKSNYSSLMEDNESLKRQMAKVAMENEILRATSINSTGASGGHDHDPQPTTTGPLRYLPTDNFSSNGKKKDPVHRIAVSRTTGEKLLDVSATWDLIVGHLSKQGLNLDVQDIYDRLKRHTQCDGQGPVIEEAHVFQAIEESIASGSGELIKI
ncbi:hypothetical protein PAAG_05122 [Paracoccidioides lutzii Pb01]|uniref:BZIP domain-containing protein n=1 Tax=Paracoccidioides lutzii (strain ATCC MYA-826 / Pb01) TaxID=502779 RepID=C1H2X9_PARBA|nr:hypothetical protein PAAG_05122 [Paracoccidioides lutzii Pb01]EEH34073.1 hypothetical protein PAAG_05122 [Paracoccidioides lutzii Pb01]